MSERTNHLSQYNAPIPFAKQALQTKLNMNTVVTQADAAFSQSIAEKRDTDAERVFLKTLYDIKKVSNDMFNKIMNNELQYLLKTNPGYKYKNFDIVGDAQGARTYRFILAKG